MKRTLIISVLAVVLLTGLLGGIEGLLFQDTPLLCFCVAAVAVSWVALWLSNRLVPRHSPSTWLRWHAKNLTSFCFLCVVWTALFLSLYLFPPFFISPKTTYITEPRLSDFYGVEYLTTLERNVPPEDNAARQIIAAVGRNFVAATDEEGERYWKRICSQLDLPEKFEPAIHYTWSHEFGRTLSEEANTILKNRNDSAFEDEPPLPYSGEMREILQPWVESNESAFALFEEALQKPVFYLPPVYQQVFLLLDAKEAAEKAALEDKKKKPAVLEERRTRQLSDSCTILEFLAYDFYRCCLYHLSLGNTESAWHDVRQMHRCIELYHPSTSDSLDHTWRMQIHANKAAESVLRYGHWDSAEMRRAYQELLAWKCLWTDTDTQRVLHGQRFVLLAGCQDFAQEITYAIPLPACIFPFGQAMVTFNRSFNERIKENNNSNRKRFNDNIGVGDLFRYGLRNFGGFWLGTEKFHDECNIIADRIDRKKTEMELTALVFALELYRKENEDRYPETLEPLCNGYIEKVPVDPFSNAHEPMKYRVNADFTGYMVYSVGVNRIDEGGQTDRAWGRGDIRRKWNYEE